MSIVLHRFQTNLTHDWDSFVSDSANGTLFHLRRFLSYHAPGKFIDYSWIFKVKNRIIGVFPAVLLTTAQENSVVSHPGSSYGGIVYGNEMGIRQAHDMVHLLLQQIRQDKISTVRITVPPVWYDVQPNQYIEFALLSEGFSYQKQELSSVVSLRSLPQDFEDSLADATRRAIQKAIKNGVTIEWSNNIRDYYSILKQNLSLRHNVKPTHSLSELIHLQELFPDKIFLLAAFYEEKMIGGIVPFICNSRVVLAFYISHAMEFQHLRAVDYLMASFINWAREKGFHYVDFGTFTLNMEPNWGLGKFKEKFSARGAFRSTLILTQK